MENIAAVETFKAALREVLGHLYDPTFVLPDQVALELGVAPQQRVDAVRTRIVRAIGELAPGPEVPVHVRSRRLHQILALRYLEQLTQEEAAIRLAITVRHLAREQALAIEMLARYLWQNARHGENSNAEEGLTHDQAADEPDAEMAEGGTERPSPQVEHELTLLRASDPDAVVDLGVELRDVVRLTLPFAARQGVSLRSEAVEQALVVAAHPSVVRQALVAAITYLVRGSPGGAVAVGAVRTGEEATISIAAWPTEVAPPPANWLGRELLNSQDGEVESERLGERLVLRFRLPLSRRIKVLVIDDNQDLVHFYGLCMAGTVYRMIHVSEGRRALGTVAAARPDLIVLDLMLPDMDGWELLAQLHEHPSAKTIPIIVCSVVREEDLALALGATLCVAKPVRRQQFLQALDEALNRAATAGQPANAHTEEPY